MSQSEEPELVQPEVEIQILARPVVLHQPLVQPGHTQERVVPRGERKFNYRTPLTRNACSRKKSGIPYEPNG